MKKKLALGCFVAAVALIPAQNALAAGWRYSSTEDAMRGSTEKIAELKSNNRVSLQFPYQGGSDLTIVLRHSQRLGGLSAMVQLSKGQLLCEFRGCNLVVKFDDEPIMHLWAHAASGGHRNTIFLQDESPFLARLRSAKKVIIEVDIWKHGPTQFTFQATGLDWK
ncbi:hypothetical protein [Achromobacter sp. AGC25]